jgi:hypothetical protein
LKTVEIFSGTKSFSKVAASRGHTIFTVDNNPKLSPTLVYDLLDDTMPEELIKEILELTECALQERNLM